MKKIEVPEKYSRSQDVYPVSGRTLTYPTWTKAEVRDANQIDQKS